MSEQNAVIARCSSCNTWLASTNSRFIEEHISSCKASYNDEASVNVNNGSTIILHRRPIIDYRHTVRCIADIDGIKTKVIVAHIRRGKFLVLSTAVYEYRYMVGRVIDASDICTVIL